MFVSYLDLHLEIGRQGETTASSKKLREAHIEMFECLIDKIVVTFNGRVFQQTVSTPTGTTCAPPPIDLLVYFYEVDIHTGPSHEKRQQLVRSIMLTFLYIHYMFSLNITKLTILILFIKLSLTYRKTQIQQGILHTLTQTQKQTVQAVWKLTFRQKR